MSSASLPNSISESTSRRQIRFSDLESLALFWLVNLALYGVMIMNHTHIETNDQVKLAGGLELLLRLGTSGIAGVIGMYGLVFMPRVRNAFFSFPGAWVMGVSIMYVIGTVCSPYFSYSMPHLITFGCVVLFSPTAFAVLGTRQTVNVMINSMVITMVASWFLYLAMPEYGVMIEITDLSGATVERMGGTSHPNVLAGACSLLLVMLSYMWFEKKMSTLLVIPLLLLCGLTLLETGTRVALVASVVSVVVVYRGFWFEREILPFTIIFSMLAAIIILFMSATGAGKVASATSFTRSGDMEEITSVTGRAEIWEYCIKKVWERPLRGYGPGSAKIILNRKQMLLHTHNVIISMGVIGGVICAFCGFMMFIHQFWISVCGNYRLAALISFVIIMNSFTENPIFDYVPGAPTVLWLVAVFWPVLDDGSL